MSGIAPLREQVIHRCAAQCGWRSPEELIAHLDATAGSFGDRHYLFYLRESEYCDGVMQLANGFEFVVRTVHADPSAIEVLESVAIFWRAWAGQLSQDGLLPDLRAAWLETLYVFDGTIEWCRQIAKQLRRRLGVELSRGVAYRSE